MSFSGNRISFTASLDAFGEIEQFAFFADSPDFNEPEPAPYALDQAGPITVTLPTAAERAVLTEKWFRFTMLGDGQASSGMRVIGDDNMQLDLLSLEGGVLRSGAGALSLRGLPADSYHVRLYNNSTELRPFTIEFDAPIRGYTDETNEWPDIDIIRGGDGNDFIVGNHGIDQLFGGSGVDTFTAEPIEVRDRDAADQDDIRVPTSQASFGQQNPVVDPIVGLYETVLFYEDFESGGFTIDGRWVGNTGSPQVDGTGISEPSGIFSARLNGASDSIVSKVLDLAGAEGAELSYWYQQTGGGESPDPNNDLILEYPVDGVRWHQLDRHFGADPDMSIYVQRRITLPSAALRNSFQFRFRVTGDGPSFDDWFIDDVQLTSLNQGSTQLRAAISETLGRPVTSAVVPGSQAVDFNGSNQYLQAPFAAAQNPDSDFAVELWAKNEGGTSNLRSVITSRDIHDNSTKALGYMLHINEQDRWQFWTGQGNGGWDVVTGPTAALNTWTHIALVFDGTEAPDANGAITGIKQL